MKLRGQRPDVIQRLPPVTTVAATDTLADPTSRKLRYLQGCRNPGVASKPELTKRSRAGLTPAPERG